MSKNHMSISAQFRADFWDSGLVYGTRSQQEDGQTKFEIKQDLREQGITSFHEVAQHAPIKESTAKGYISSLKEMGNYLKSNGLCLDEQDRFDVKLVTADHVYSWLSNKVEENLEKAAIGEKMNQGADRIDNIVSACNKWAAAADRTRNACLVPSVERATAEFRENVLPDMPQSQARIRAYENPEAVIKELANGTGNQELNARAQLVAEIQLRTGLRVDNARRFELKPNGRIAITSKGGMQHPSYQLPQDLYARALSFNGGILGHCKLIAYKTYLDKLSGACKRIGVDYSKHASHGFRHAYAKSRYKELLGNGMSDARAKATVSQELFHRRLDVVEIYLK